jgi:hypothetical protein
MCFLSNLRKISNIVPLGNQIEAIALLEITPSKHRLYISNENTSSYGSMTIPFPAKLWLIEIDTETINLNVPDILLILLLTFFQIHLIKY